MAHILIVTSPYYAEIASELTKGAKATLDAVGATYEVINVPGAFEIPAAIRFALESNRYDGYIALGCVIRGETTHYDYVCTESARGIMDLSLKHKVPVGYGILTVENMEQAFVRASIQQGNKGKDAADACLRLIELKKHYAA